MAGGEALVLLRTDPGRLSAWGLESEAEVAVVRIDAAGEVLSCFAAGAGAVMWQGEALETQTAP